MRSFSGIQYSIAFLLGIIGIMSCKDEHKGIPAQISVDSVSLDISSLQGNNIHQIRGVQVFANEEFIGNFEFPCKIPITKLGNIRLEIFPLVYINGSKNNLGIYTPMASYVDTFLLQAGKSIPIKPIFTFRKNAFVRWNEDFEDNNSTLIPIAPSPYPGDSISIVSTPFDLDGKFKSTTKAYRIVFEDIDSSKYIDVGSFEEFKDLPLDGSSVFFEFDVKSDLPVQLAMRRKILRQTNFCHTCWSTKPVANGRDFMSIWYLNWPVNPPEHRFVFSSISINLKFAPFLGKYSSIICV